MTLPSPLHAAFSEMLGALSADLDGELRDVTPAGMSGRDPATVAASMRDLAEAGAAAGLSRLQLVVVKGETEATVTALRPDELLLVALAPSKGTVQVERALHAWAAGEDLPPAADAAAAGDGAAPRDAAPAPPPPLPASTLPRPPVVALHASADRARRATAPSRAPSRGDPWAALRRSLVRGLLTEAGARRRELADPAFSAPRAGAEPVEPAELDRAMQLLLQGIGSVLAGDGVGGARTLEPLVHESQPNLSFRWLALYWSGRAALRSGDSAGARRHLRQALLVAKLLDLDAVSVSQWIAAEVLAHDGDHERALVCLAQARGGFQRLSNRWGLGQAWLAEARVLVSAGREDEALEAARQAWAADPSWEEPPVFLARRALARDALDEAEAMLRSVDGPAVERVRSLVAAMREQIVTPADAGEFLRESEGPPTARAIRALERIARAAPRFLQAREALAWMLLKTGKYAEASVLFRALLAQQLTPADRASVMLGLGCIAHAQQTGKSSDARLHAAVAAAASAPPPDGAAEVPPLPPMPVSALPGRSSQLASSSAVFSGQLSVFSLPDVVEFVRTARRTGLLVCSSARGVAAVHFREGRITGARAPGTPDLGEILMGARKISTAALRGLRSARPPGQPDHVLGDLLIREGLVDAASVEEALRRQAEATLLELVRWKDGEFAFNREGDAEAPEHAVELDAQEALLNVFRRLDEEGRGPSAAAAQP